jgi:hypothetical protein
VTPGLMTIITNKDTGVMGAPVILVAAGRHRRKSKVTKCQTLNGLSESELAPRARSMPNRPCLAVRNASELTTQWLVARELRELVPSNQLWRCSGSAQPGAAPVAGRTSTNHHSPELVTLIERNELWNAMHGPPNSLSCCH